MSALGVRARVAGRLDVDLRVDDGEVVAVLGRNGAGKSTLLSVVAGLLRVDDAEVTLGGRVLDAAGVHVPPHRRRVALLAQEPLLFPHLSVAENVAFGPRARGSSRAASRAEATRWLGEVDAIELGPRAPATLSGGQAQRVAVARALAARPDLLLLDEPMGALDVSAAPALRQLLRTVLGGTTAMIVTHDVLDALVLADRVVVLEGGVVVESGPVREVLARPRSAFAARLAGLNLMAGAASGAGLRTAGGAVVRGAVDPGCGVGDAAVAVFRPGAVAVHTDRPTDHPGTVLAVHVTSVEPVGELVRLRADGADGVALMADLAPVAVAVASLVPGAGVWFAVGPTEVSVYPA